MLKKKNIVVLIFLRKVLDTKIWFYHDHHMNSIIERHILQIILFSEKTGKKNVSDFI